MDRTTNLTTREAADFFGCRPKEALALLRAAGVDNERLGSAFLWDAAGVLRLAETLFPKDSPIPREGGAQ